MPCFGQQSIPPKAQQQEAFRILPSRSTFSTRRSSVSLPTSDRSQRQGPLSPLSLRAVPAISLRTPRNTTLPSPANISTNPPPPPSPAIWQHRHPLTATVLLANDSSAPSTPTPAPTTPAFSTTHPGAFHITTLLAGPVSPKTTPTLSVMHHKQHTHLDQTLPYRSADSRHSEPSSPTSSTMDTTTHALPKQRPDSSRSTTEPSPAVLLQNYFSSPPAPRPTSSHRNRSPYSRPHVRSRSGGSSLAAPPMARAHSLPSVNSASRGFDLQSASPPSGGSLSPSPMYGSPARVRSPFKVGPDEGYVPPPRSPSWYESSASTGGAIESIQEDSELDLTPRQQPVAAASASFSRSGSLRRRPASPLHSFANVPAIIQQPPTSFPASVIDQNATINMNPSSTSSSPSLGAQKYNEAFPSALSLHHYASNSSFSSISSTPSSARSRSPSISSLDTIEDVPDLESEAVEEESQRLKLIAESDEEEEGSRRRSLDVSRGFGFGRNGGSGRERKRWSICGGERRADLDLETIWED